MGGKDGCERGGGGCEMEMSGKDESVGVRGEWAGKLEKCGCEQGNGDGVRVRKEKGWRELTFQQ